MTITYIVPTVVCELLNLKSSSHDVIWVIPFNTISIFICLLYLLPNLTRPTIFWLPKLNCHESVIKKYLTSEIIFSGDFNRHYFKWLRSSTTIPRGELANEVSALCSWSWSRSWSSILFIFRIATFFNLTYQTFSSLQMFCNIPCSNRLFRS